MSTRNNAPVLIISLVATLALLGGGGWWLAKQIGIGFVSTTSSTTPNASLPSSNVSTETNSAQNNPTPGNGTGNSLAGRLSIGDKSLIAETIAPAKQQAIASIQAGDYGTAVSQLESYLQQNRNDPEALIYLNNARIGTQSVPTIAVAVPAATAVNSAQEILRGVAQAQNEINLAGGLNGRPLKVMVVSDDNDPAIASQLADSLVQDASVVGVIGHFGSSTSLEAAQVYEQGQLVMISPTSTSVRISEAGSYIFRTVPSDRFTASALSRHLVNQMGIQNAALYYNAESDYSQSLKNEFTTALYADGGQIVTEGNVTDSGFNASASIADAIQRGAEAIVLATNTATLDQAIQLIAANNQRLAVLGGDSLYNPQLLQAGNRLADGMVVAVPWVLLSNPQASFAQASRQQWGGDVNWRTAMAYDGAIALADAIRQNPTRNGVQQALADPGFRVEGATGTVQFLPSGDRNQAMQLVTVSPGTRSGYGYDFVPE
ncbi:MAG: ABC transporter substrate-binding protein [Cyanobacteria bacterium P01_E01_bin.6]